jgi:hypothetical protein
MFRNIYTVLIKKPVLSLFLITFVVNLPAVFFSKGYGMHDDHFGPIEQPWEIINNPKVWESRTTPHAHSIFYPLLHFLLFKLLYQINIKDPQDVMLIVRLLHSLYSTLTIIFIYKILKEFYEEKIAFQTSLVIALLWFMPFLSVRNLIEMVCIPPLAIGYYFLVRKNQKPNDLVLSALFFALAFAFRYQTLFISGTVFLILLFSNKLSDAFKFGLSFLLFIFLIQGSVDIFAWGYPLASFIEYVRYNFTHSGDYVTGPFYRYLLLLIGVFIPPLSLLILYYSVKRFKDKLLIILPVLVFFLFHSIFPNKQERFILPIVPFVFALGAAELLSAKGELFNLNKMKTFYRLSWIIFWFINIPLLIIFSLNYGKKSRCESLYYLSKKPDVAGILQITGKIGAFKPPLFYLNKYGTPVYEIPNVDSLFLFVENKRVANYAVIYADEELDSLKTMTESILGRKLKFETQIPPSLVDYILYKLNPRYNKNQIATIFKIE